MRLKRALRPAWPLLALAALAACGRGGDAGNRADHGAGAENGSALADAVVNEGAPDADVAGNSAGNAAAGAETPLPAFDTAAGVRIGMTLADMRAAGMKVRRDPSPDPGSTCSYARIADKPDLFVMLDGSHVARIDTTSPLYKTLDGVHVGMSEAQARRLLGDKVVVQPHPYTGPKGHYLVVHAKGAPTGLILETDGVTVESLRLGRWEQVQWVEGCS